jgi:hypothetical protein
VHQYGKGSAGRALRRTPFVRTFLARLQRPL